MATGGDSGDKQEARERPAEVTGRPETPERQGLAGRPGMSERQGLAGRPGKPERHNPLPTIEKSSDMVHYFLADAHLFLLFNLTHFSPQLERHSHAPPPLGSRRSGQ